MRVRAILQARTDSSRLPAKALLPLCGIPSAVLAAKRAGNRGHEVVLATTERVVDDQLAAVASGARVAVFRGATDDVRRRFLEATNDLGDDDVIVRLTADNIIPDGDLVAAAVEALIGSGALLVRSMADHRLPYGLAVEAFRAGSLRASVGWRDDPYAREHVTPGLIDRAGRLPRFLDLGADLGHHRCTMDTFEDYLQLVNLFVATDAPVQVGWRALINRLVGCRASPPARSPGPGLIVGTAQLVTPYGSVTKTTPPSLAEAREIVLRAARCRYGIDTAPGYGQAEAVIGRTLAGGDGAEMRVSTKLDVSAALETEFRAVVALRAEASVLRSRLALGEVIPDLLLHRAVQRTALGGVVWQALQRLKAEGLVGKLGVSVYSPEEALDALDDPNVQIVQLPFNLLDRRWWHAGVVAAAQKRDDLVVHARSVFLQGILVRPAEAWPRLPGLDAPVLRQRLLEALRELGRRSVEDLCVAYVRGHALRHRWISGVIVGVESMQQLRENEELFSQPPLTEGEIDLVEEKVGDVTGQILDPSTWPSTS